MFQTLRKAFSRTRSLLGDGIRRLFAGQVDEEVLEQLEEMLYRADFGVKATAELVEEIRKSGRLSDDEAIQLIKDKLLEILGEEAAPLATGSPSVVLVVGVNGSGKTTTIAKLAKRLQSEGEKLLLGAGDTFRAAAIEQLSMWGERLSVPVIKHQSGGDPAAVAYDALSAGLARNVDRVILDTAGRLHTKTDLMQELEKIRKVCDKLVPGAPHETLLVLDATIGQNALDQARTFHETTPLTGLILTKLDGTARGGIAVAIRRELGLPIRYIGTGEGADDLEPFNPTTFIQSLID
jgi:fused signal recognition particle receptor